jgi:ankyrin repeat protein
MGPGMRGVARTLVAGLALAGLSAPLLAQGLNGPGYGFLKAVRDRDGDKVQEALDKPGTTVMLAQDENSGENALHIVIKRRDITWTRYMLAKGAAIDARDRQGNTALLDAAQIGFVDGAQQLLEVGATVDLANNRGETPLIIATQMHDLATVRVLVQYGADPKVTDHVAGMSAMDYAKRDGRSDAIVKALGDAKPVVKKKVSGPSL